MTDPSPAPPPADADPADTPPPAVAPSLLARARATAVAALVVTLLVAALGGGVGWFWAAITPRLQVIKSDRGFLYADPEPEQPVAADGTFLLVGLGLGIVLAVLVWVLLRRYRGAAMLAALSVGSLACSVLAFWVGHKIGVSQFNAVRGEAPIGAQLSAPVTLRVTDLDPNNPWSIVTVKLPKTFSIKLTGVLAAQALAAAFVYTSLAGFSAFEDLGRHRRRGEPDVYEPPTSPAEDPPADAPPRTDGS